MAGNWHYVILINTFLVRKHGMSSHTLSSPPFHSHIPWAVFYNAIWERARRRLSGSEPFFHENQVFIYRNILKCNYEFSSPAWDEISENAKVKVIVWRLERRSEGPGFKSRSGQIALRIFIDCVFSSCKNEALNIKVRWCSSWFGLHVKQWAPSGEITERLERLESPILVLVWGVLVILGNMM